MDKITIPINHRSRLWQQPKAIYYQEREHRPHWKSEKRSKYDKIKYFGMQKRLKSQHSSLIVEPHEFL